jgi:hypothetical protein
MVLLQQPCSFTVVRRMNHPIWSFHKATSDKFLSMRLGEFANTF